MEKKSVLEGRLAGLDILRAVAFFCIPTVHFFLNSGFYTVVMNSPKIIPMLTIRWIVYAGGVPVFIMLTGYLKKKKTVSLQNNYSDTGFILHNSDNYNSICKSLFEIENIALFADKKYICIQYANLCMVYRNVCGTFSAHTVS